MRIIIITAGTGSYFCGTCMRDNALALALRRLGHDALLVPLYLPLMLDETSASADAPLFYGGVNVYLQHISPLFRKTPRWIDKFFDNPALLRKAAGGASMTTPEQLGALTLSTLLGEDGAQRKELDRLCDWLKAEGKADVICLSNALLMGLAPRIKEKTGAFVACTLQGEDYFLDSLPEPDRSRCWETLGRKAKSADVHIAVSRYYGERMRQRAALESEKIRVVYNGIALEDYPNAQRPAPEPPTIGYLARLNPLKGLHTFVEAYALLRQRGRIPNVRLKIAGTMNSADEAYLAQIRSRLESEGLLAQTEISPNLAREAKIDFLKSLSLLSVPATYGESFGLYILEAWACGVPVVQPRHGAFPELLEHVDGGWLCEPDDPQSLAEAWESALLAPDELQVKGETGRLAVGSRFHVDAMAQAFLEAVRG